MESLTAIILSHFFGIASNLHTDAILTAQKDKLLEELRKDEKALDALRAFRPIVEDVRLACIKLADMHELLWCSPEQERLRPLLTDAHFHNDFVEWLQAGGIDEGEAVKDRILKRIEALLGSNASNEQLTFLQNHFFDAVDKAVFADPILARWRFDLSLRYLREQVAVLRRLAEENAGIFSEKEQQRVLDLYCEKALTTCDIIDLRNLPEGDRYMATQKFLLRQLYMPLRISFTKPSRDHQDDAQLKKIEDAREMRRLVEAGRIEGLNPIQTGSMEAPISIGVRLGASRRLVVLGDPGAGKTTMMRWMATAYLLRHCGDPAVEMIPDVQSLPLHPWIPVLIRCREIGREDLSRSFTDVLRSHLSKSVLHEDIKIMRAIILDRIAKGEILLLVDGLDEITDRKVRMMFCEELERMAARYPEAPILVTSRIVGYRDMPYRMRTGFDHGVISDLQAEDKEHFARRWVDVTESQHTEEDRAQSALELIKALRSTERIARLTGNPMMLTTLALVKRHVSKLPSKRSKLYAQAVKVLLDWNPIAYEQIEEDEALPQLEYLAYEMCRRGIQRLPGNEVLDLLRQIRKDFPDIYSICDRPPQEFLNKLEERSGLLMRSGDIWLPKQRQVKDVWEFRHLTFQEYLAARALIEGFYPSSEAGDQNNLPAEVARLAAPLHEEVKGVPRKKEITVSDSWREALRLLVSDCRHQDVNDVLLSILHPTAVEDPAISQLPRAVLAAQCLAEEPYVKKEIGREVLQRFVSLIGVDDGVKVITTNVEKAALEVWQSSWRKTLRSSLIQAFSDGSAATRANCGGVLALLLGSTLDGSASELDRSLEAVDDSLQSGDREEAICAALTVVQMVHEGSPARPDALLKALLRLLQQGGSEAHAAAWALAWLSVEPPLEPAKRSSMFRNRLLPPVLATEWEGTGAGGWHPTEEQTGVLLDALGRAEVSEGEGKRHLLVLLGKSAQPSVVLPLLQYVADPDPAVREASREALAWMANHLPAPLQPAQLDALEEQLGAGLVRNDSLADAERCDGLVVMALFGHERLLREVLADQGAPVALRRQAAEGLGLVAYRCGNADQRQRLRDELEGLMRGHAFDLLVTGAEGWAEHDQCLPVLRGASRGLQMAASEDLPLLGVQPRQDLSMLTLTALQEDEGLRIRTEVVDRAVWRLPLPEGEHLELVVVQAGEYSIGSPEEEEGRDLYGLSREKGKNVNVEARRLVRLERFALTRYPVTQAQWRAVASLMRLERDLNLIPSRYKPDDLWDRHAQPGVQPVESVSWNDCQEWLKRLNHWLKEQWPEMCGLGEAPQLALPSESQWEVACRAGANTPFHFGDTLDATWANYDGNSKYGTGRTGIYRKRPGPVGFFGLVNYWGLAEMHGQLWEWCANQWCADPLVGSAVDESPLEGLDSTSESKKEVSSRLLRGGSWFLVPRNCRAAYRFGAHPAFTDTVVGFRPCCLLPPGSLLGS